MCPVSALRVDDTAKAKDFCLPVMTVRKVRITDLGPPKMLRNAQMTAVRTLRRGWGATVEWLLWADCDDVVGVMSLHNAARCSSSYSRAKA